MSIEQIAAQVSPAIAAAPASGGRDTVGKDDFLRLLVTQLQKQDPLNPQDPAEFTAQLTQFSSLEQLIKVNESIGALAEQQALAVQTGAAAYLGRTAQIAGDTVRVSGGQAGSLRFELPAASARTSVNVYDEAGALVDVATLGALGSGAHEYRWPAVRSDGTPMPDGTYRLEVVAQDVAGSTIPVSTSVSGAITGVRFEGGRTLLEIGGERRPIGDLLAVW